MIRLLCVLGSDLDLSAPAESVVTKVGVDPTARPFMKDLPAIAMSTLQLQTHYGKVD